MNTNIHLDNRYYPWNRTEIDGITCWVKGQLFFNKELLSGLDILSLHSGIRLNSKNDKELLKDLYSHFNGSFALVIETPDKIFCIVDRIRSIPLFYSNTRLGLIISDDAYYIKNRINTSFNEKNGSEFLFTGYVTGPETLFNEIFQIQSGEYLIYSKSDGNFSLDHYFYYLHRNYLNESEDRLIKCLDDVMVRVFNRLIDTTINEGKTIVVPLSGGLDSRLIVAMLKRLGVKDVICFSYGDRGNSLILEAKISRSVANALGYKWFFIEYTMEEWQNSICSEEMNQYFSYCGNLTSLPHIQDFLAIQKLKCEGKIPDNSVFVPGHSGDFLAGSYIPKDYKSFHYHSIDNYVKEILTKHYCFWDLNENPAMLILFKEKILKVIQGFSINDLESYTNLVDFFVFNEKVAKFVVNSVRAYEFFGFQWRIPLWDSELIDFFLRIPFNERLNEKLYTKYAFYLFLKHFRKLLTITCTTPLNMFDKSFFILLDIIYKYKFRSTQFNPFLPKDFFSLDMIREENDQIYKISHNIKLKERTMFPYLDNYLAANYITRILTSKSQIEDDSKSLIIR